MCPFAGVALHFLVDLRVIPGRGVNNTFMTRGAVRSCHTLCLSLMLSLSAVAGEDSPEIRSAATVAESVTQLEGWLGEKRYHKATEGAAQLLAEGLPREDAQRVRGLLARGIKEIGFPEVASEFYFDTLRANSDLPGYGPLLLEWRGMALEGAALRPFLDHLPDLPVRADPLGDEGMRLLRGLRALEDGDGAAALVAFEDITTSPGLVRRARFLQGTLLAKEGLFLDAERQLAAALAIPATDEAEDVRLILLISTDLARLAYSRGDGIGAVNWYRRVLEKIAPDAPMERELAWALLRADKPIDAWQLAQSLVSGPQWPPDLLLLQGLCYLRTNQPEEAGKVMAAAQARLKLEMDTIRVYLSQNSRENASDVALELLHLSPLPGSTPRVGGAAPPSADLLAWIRTLNPTAGWIESHHHLAAELARVDKQPSWWRAGAAGKMVTELARNRSLWIERAAGLALLSTLETQQRELNRLMVQSHIAQQPFLLKSSEPPPPPWTGDPLPPFAQ